MDSPRLLRAKTPAKTTTQKTLSSIVQDKIAAEIAAGAFAPGTRLEENELARRYQVSRTPIREALRELASLGAVEIKARRGVLVADLEGGRLLKTLEVVAELEASCARYAAGRMTDPQRVALKKLHGQIADAVRAGDSARYDRDNLQFHLLIHAGSGNEVLADAVGQMRRRILPYTRAELISNPGQLAISYREHEAIVRAIESHNGELAYHTTRAHVIAAGQVRESRMLTEDALVEASIRNR
jgi:DNA-binding GntR family transcriptional regulator